MTAPLPGPGIATKRRPPCRLQWLGVVTEEPLAEVDLPPGRRWKPWDIAISWVVDTARNGPLT